MARTWSAARLATGAGLVACAAGVVVLFLQALSEVAADPSLSLGDAYWIGRLPGTAIGVDLVIVGATTTLIAGGAIALVAGGLARRSATAIALVVAALWWLLAMQPAPQGAYCADCPSPTADPVTMAYSRPEFAIVLLLLPAIVVGSAALSARRRRQSSALLDTAA